MTSHRDDVKILQLQYFTGVKVHRIVMFLVQIIAQMQLTMIKLYNAITEETIKIFHSHFCLILCASFEESKGLTEAQAVKPWLKFFEKIVVDLIFGP